ncbi:MAG TPA: hypothetical protein VEQ18_04175 [Candidatus Nitrosocosmicus sp.]|nr:hypothetical protein [Candidatus Nitrosocosmicus sp.]
MLGKYVEFTPHPKSLDGINAPTQEELASLGFLDVNTALANTVEAMENGPHKGFSKQDIEKLMKDAVKEGNNEIRKEIGTMKESMLKEAKDYSDSSHRKLDTQLALLKQTLAATMQCIDSVAERSDMSAIEGNMDTPNYFGQTMQR